MATGISGLYKGTRGAKAAAKAKYEKEIKALAKRWNVSLERAFEAIMKRIDRGLPPLPPVSQKKSKKAGPKATSETVKVFVPTTSAEIIDEMHDQAAHGGEDPFAVSAESAKKILESAIAADTAKAVAGEHYDLPHAVNESIELIEILMVRQNIPRIQVFMISQALRYILRVGVKTPDWGKDIAKAENYLHRALTGAWIAKGK